MLLSSIDLLNVKIELTSELLTSLALTAPLKFKTAVCAFALIERTDISTVLPAMYTLRMDENFMTYLESKFRIAGATGHLGWMIRNRTHRMPPASLSSIVICL
jgi:hypothetical protein